ncbi:hypothetical protein MUK42_33624 [Musa troglodytarum]|uniref:Uncharacterized protein n=1 Tax=Musa troglodytarum TaxID=320322 RepID=A0A9E7E8K6_9LILI|nr:hypothetical protein MUK42_33624 [Musa troglodytarum]
MVGLVRPIFVLFGSSIVQFSFSNEGWGAILAGVYARKMFANETHNLQPLGGCEGLTVSGVLSRKRKSS